MLSYKVKHFIPQIICIKIKKDQRKVKTNKLILILIKFTIKVKITNIKNSKKELKKYHSEFNNIFLLTMILSL